MHLREWKTLDDDRDHRIAIELKEKMHGLDKQRLQEIEIQMERAHKALEELKMHEFNFEMPEIEILELDGAKNRVVVVPTPEVRGRLRVAPTPGGTARVAPTPPSPPTATWGESDSRLERLEQRVNEIEALIEKIMRKLEEREG